MQIFTCVVTNRKEARLLKQASYIMKSIAFSLLLFVRFALHSQYTIKEYPQAYLAHQSEELGPVLLESARLFTAKLNEYRKRFRAKELVHMDQTWLMAYNHCVWMRAHKNLSHSEKRGSTFYSGYSTSQRLNFVQAGFKFSSLGENIAYTELHDDDLEDVQNLATLLAEEFFVIWKKSSGHRKNMLDKSFTEHGVTILQSGDRFYAVHVFYGK